ncbi:hypothetical protein H5410_052378 [Solanum commersonii]|uniref:Uncharacterized protein n=1 Tax=Solanum commersonii TaxID=4109 RepID=A0A9J5X222_SOLCO|nr:hypothetical protein H5410_052378 [Solanum commersonii]
MDIWLEFVGGKKKGRVKGLGSLGRSVKASSKQSTSALSREIDEMIKARVNASNKRRATGKRTKEKREFILTSGSGSGEGAGGGVSSLTKPSLPAAEEEPGDRSEIERALSSQEDNQAYENESGDDYDSVNDSDSAHDNFNESDYNED